MSIAYTYKGDLANAVERAEMAVKKAPTLADKVWAQTQYGFASCRRDKTRAAAELLASLAPMYDATQFIPGQVFNTTYLVEAYWRAGDIDAAEVAAQKGLDISTRAGMKFYSGSMHRMMGEIVLAKNPDQSAEPLAGAHFEESFSLLSGTKAENELALAYAGYSRFLKPWLMGFLIKGLLSGESQAWLKQWRASRSPADQPLQQTGRARRRTRSRKPSRAARG